MGFRVETEDTVFFFKLKKDLPQSGMVVASLLLELGIPVAAPIKSKSALTMDAPR